jgi:hypothetical protein
MKKGFYSVAFGLVILCVIMVSGITYYKLQESLKKGWKLTEANYDTSYTGGLGWSRGYGDWNVRKEGGRVEGMESGSSSTTPSGSGSGTSTTTPPSGSGSGTLTTTPLSGSGSGTLTTPVIQYIDASAGGNISSTEDDINDWLGNTDASGYWRSENWVAPGWSVLWKGEEEGGVDIDQVFHKSSLEGEYGDDSYPPFDEDTINRLGGGWKLDHIYPDEKKENSLIPPSGPPDDSYGKINGDLTFYAPGTFMYGADSYVPSYATSVLLSPMLGVNAPLKPLVGEGQGGSLASKSSVCSPGSGASTLEKESYCQKLSPMDAAGRECCVVLGGELPMAGNDQGPYNQTIYTNPVASGKKDYYIYLGKCYGNCPPSYKDLTY